MRDPVVKYREVFVPGISFPFEVPTNVSRVDCNKWHGWQVRIRRLDATGVQKETRGWVPGAATSFANVTRSLAEACAMADKMRTPTAELVRSDAGVFLDVRIRERCVQFDVCAADPKGNVRRFYVGTSITITEERYLVALKKAQAHRDHVVAIHLANISK